MFCCLVTPCGEETGRKVLIRTCLRSLLWGDVCCDCVCAGYFTQISTLADVQENVMEYLHVLSRPKVIDQEHDTVWTEAYVDNTVSNKAHTHTRAHTPYPESLNNNLKEMPVDP